MILMLARSMLSSDGFRSSFDCDDSVATSPIPAVTRLARYELPPILPACSPHDLPAAQQIGPRLLVSASRS